MHRIHLSPVPEAALSTPHDPDAPIQPVAFRPLDRTNRAPRRPRLRPLPLMLLAAALLAVAALALLLGARGVRIDTVPGDARVALDGGLALHWGRRWLLHQGSYRLRASAPGYRELNQALEVTDARDQHLALTLEPLPGHLALTTTPVGAAVRLDGSARGTTPLTLRDLPAGRHRLEVALPRHQPVARDIDIEGRDRTQELALELAPAWGRVKIDSAPGGADVKVAGSTRGTTPAEVEMVAGEELMLELPGYRPWRQRIEIAPGASLDLGVQQLEPRARPAPEPRRAPAKPAAETAAQPAAQTPASTTPASTTLAAALPAAIEAPGGGVLRLFRPEGSFTLGAGRREQGRRADQVARQVQLQRPFYLGVHEVTNAQFRRFQRGHSSSHAGGKTLDLVRQPVVKVSWTEAARFCNWLSREAGLKPFYQERGGGIAGVDATATGYRLPTEAEWEWAARSAPGGGRRTFPWGDAFPPPAASENIAGQEAAELVASHLATLDDGFAVSAPVGSFPANARGLVDLGGNVAEWVHDFYEVPLPDAAPARDPLGPARGSAHVIRGPSWRHGGLVELRLAYRDQGAAGRDDVGFRLARYAE